MLIKSYILICQSPSVTATKIALSAQNYPEMGRLASMQQGKPVLLKQLVHATAGLAAALLLLATTAC